VIQKKYRFEMTRHGANPDIVKNLRETEELLRQIQTDPEYKAGLSATK
jgi:hypothetical protein